MSHTTTIKKTLITDIKALEKAVEQLNKEGVSCSLVKNGKPRMYYPDQLKKDTGKETAPYVVKLHGGKYDVAFTATEDGKAYAPVFDEWGGHVGGQLGAACALPTDADGRTQHQIGRLMQAYAVHAAKRAAQAKGYSVRNHSIDADGNVKLVLAGIR